MTAIPTHSPAQPRGERVPVWDLPTRLFHWGLAGLVLLSWLTGEGDGAAGQAHRLSGEAIAGLVIFRLVWGFVGGEHARFADFIRRPAAVIEHVRDLFAGRAAPTLGHNPLGGLAVILLLASVAGVVVTGLFSFGDEGPGGPLAGRFGWDLSGLHEPMFRVLQAVVALHLAGVAVTSLVTRENLVSAMITGLKRRASRAGARPARRGSALALIAALVIGASASAYLMALPHPVGGGERAGAGQHRDGAGGEARERDAD